MKPQSQLAQELRKNTTAVRVSFNWFNTRKTLESHHRSQAASTFGADKNYLSATQKLVNTRHPKFAALTRIKGDIVSFWKLNTLPYTEDGIRLINRSKIDAFEARMKEFREAFALAVDSLDQSLEEIREEAKNRLGSLFNPAHYPESIKDEFGFEWSFPSIEPPEYLASLAPGTYKLEQEKIEARLQEAVALAETAFISEFKELVDALSDRLQPGEDGKKKIFKESTVVNFQEFFKRFKELHLGSNADLEKLVVDAEKLLEGINAEELRSMATLRGQVKDGLKQIGEQLTPMVIPRRKIIVPKKLEAAHATQESAA